MLLSVHPCRLAEPTSRNRLREATRGTPSEKKCAQGGSYKLRGRICAREGPKCCDQLPRLFSPTRSPPQKNLLHRRLSSAARALESLVEGLAVAVLGLIAQLEREGRNAIRRTRKRRDDRPCMPWPPGVQLCPFRCRNVVKQFLDVVPDQARVDNARLGLEGDEIQVSDFHWKM